MSSPSQVLVGCSDKVVCIRVRGRGTFLNSAGVKQFAREMIHRGHREFVVDLENCPVMDSTFMGTLTGVALHLRSLGQGQLHVIHCNVRNTDLLRGLGLDQILDLADEDCGCDEGQPKVELTPQQAADRRLTTETMLAAHKALVEADANNLSRFKDVLEYLKQDLARSDCPK